MLALVAPFLAWPVAVGAAIGALSVLIYRNWHGIVAFLAGAFVTIGENAQALWDALSAGFDATFGLIAEGIGQAVEYVRGRLDWLGGAIGRFVEGARNRLQSLLRLIGVAGERSGSAGGGASVPRYAAGGAVRGPGTSTSDSILSWLSDGEFVVRARAVRHYGADLFRQLNSMTFPRGGLMGGYASGGLVSGSTVPVVAGPAAPAGPYANLNLTIGGESLSGLMAPRETADRLVRFALADHQRLCPWAWCRSADLRRGPSLIRWPRRAA